MNIKGFLQDLWNDVIERHGPFRPAPEVQEKLEAQGYTFKPSYIAGPGYAVPSLRILASNGQEVGGWGNAAITAQYHQDYNRAVAECAATAETAKPAPGPSPQA